jgi:hypothetical protein
VNAPEIGASRAALSNGARATSSTAIEMSAMGERARRAVRALASRQTPVAPRGLSALPNADRGDVGDDDEGGGPGALDDGGDLPGGNQGELAIAVDDSGQHVVIGFNDFRGFPLSPISVSGVMWSDDGGQTFHDGGQLSVDAPVDVGGTLLPQVFGDPDIRYLGDCNFIYTSILLAPFGDGSEVQTMGFHRSRDCGQTWEGPFEITSASNPSGLLSGADPVDAADKEFVDVDRTTGRVLMTWTNFTANAVEVSSTYSDNVLEETPTWSPRVIVGNRPIDGTGSYPQFGPAGSRKVYVAWGTFFENGNRGVSVARSDDDGATFSAPIDLVPDGFFPMDQILGNDRVHSFPAVAVDRSFGHQRGNVYVAYAPNDGHDGADVVVQRSTDRAATFDAPVDVTSRPGADRAQWFPALASDPKTGRVHLFYYDQGVADSGDLTQSTFTFSDDGVRWAAPRRLSPATFHAGWGNDTSQPNLGDYNHAVVNRRGDLLAAYAITRSVGFRDGEPGSNRMTVPEPIVTDKARAEQHAITTVDLQGTSVHEVPGAADLNGSLDAGETFAVSLSLRNYVTNPLNARTIDGALAVVHATTAGVRTLLGATLFPKLGPGETRTSITPVILALDPTFPAGQDVTLAIQVFSKSGAPVDLEATLHTGTPDVVTVLVSENFDEVAPGTLPANWASVHGGGGNTVPWTTDSTFCGTKSNAAFHVNADDGVDPTTDNARWERLTGPTFTVPVDADYVTVDLDVCTDTEDDPTFKIQAFDGLFVRFTNNTPGDVLRSVLAEAFETDFTTDGFFGYPKHLPRNNNPNYFQDMSVWAGDSGGIRHVKMRLAGMAGSTATLRLEFTQDDIATCADVRPGHSCGVLVDNIVIKSVKSRR